MKRFHDGKYCCFSYITWLCHLTRMLKSYNIVIMFLDMATILTIVELHHAIFSQPIQFPTQTCRQKIIYIVGGKVSLSTSVLGGSWFAKRTEKLISVVASGIFPQNPRQIDCREETGKVFADIDIVHAPKFDQMKILSWQLSLTYS